MTRYFRSYAFGFTAVVLLFCTQSAAAGNTDLSTSATIGPHMPYSDVGENTIRVPQVARATAIQSKHGSNEVEIAQYGEPEEEASFKDAGFQVVRFDPPFAPPYTITKIAFPSLTVNGVPAVFPSVRLCGADSRGLPLLSSPLMQIANYSGSADGVNEIPINLAVSDSGKIFYWCIEFPSKFSVDFPNDYPFIRMDALDMDRGYFFDSFEVTPTGGLTDIFPDRNLIVSMTCRLPTEDQVPIEASSNLGANRIGSAVRFSFLRPKNHRADGSGARKGPLLRTDLLFRSSPLGRWQPWASVGGNKTAIDVDSLEHRGGLWTTQAVDRGGHRAITSSVVVTAPFSDDRSWDTDEPNGLPDEATDLVPPVVDRRETIFPAGDKDNFSFLANLGETIETFAYRTFASGYNDLDLVMLLFDSSGRLVASDDSSYFGTPKITFQVPQGSPERRFTLQVSDIQGSFLSPNSAPRPIVRAAYILNLQVGAAAAMQFRGQGRREKFSFRTVGPNPANTARLLYELPPDAAYAPVRVMFYDVQGRLVRSLVTRGDQAGPNFVIWDGNDDQGRSVSSGTYYAHISVGSFQGDQKISILK